MAPSNASPRHSKIEPRLHITANHRHQSFKAFTFGCLWPMAVRDTFALVLTTAFMSCAVYFGKFVAFNHASNSREAFPAIPKD
eukprot:scaffold9359_cov30-Prasinocladus_malaysianus.AAC.2